MNYRGAIAEAYGRMFGKPWGQMTEEERNRALRDPSISSKLEAQQDIYMRRRADARNRAFQQEQQRSRARNAGPGVGTWG